MVKSAVHYLLPTTYYLPRLTLVRRMNLKGLGSTRFARHYSEYRYLLSLPQPTKMFQFSWFPFILPIYSEADNAT